MASPRIEHVNITVRDPDRAARLMGELFGWEVRWQGPALNGGHTIMWAPRTSTWRSTRRAERR